MAGRSWERREIPAPSPASSLLPSPLCSLFSPLVSHQAHPVSVPALHPRREKAQRRRRAARREGSDTSGEKASQRKERRFQRELSIAPGRFPERDSGSPGIQLHSSRSPLSPQSSLPRSSQSPARPRRKSRAPGLALPSLEGSPELSLPSALSRRAAGLRSTSRIRER